MNSNIGLMFYKDYFKSLNFDHNGNATMSSFVNHEIFQLNLNSDLKKNDKSLLKSSEFELTTIYPGLLIGSGYNHEIGGFENELKLGFFFDHTTGLPCIPGSSVKGLLREAAEKANGHYLEYILTEIKDGKRNLKDAATKEMADAFLTENLNKLLGGKTSTFVKSVFDGEGLPIYKRDIFFDAFPVASGNENGKFLANDYITHHEHPLKNPNPVQFLKVLPNVAFRFEFKLTDEVMDATLKLELFRQILLDLGIGAKTNVGYGKFTAESIVSSNADPIQNHTTENNPNRPGQPNQQPLNTQFFKEEIPNKAKNFLKKNETFSGRITRIDGNLIQISFVVNEATCVVYKQLEKLKNPNSLEIKTNAAVSVKIGLDYAYPNNLNCQVTLV